MKKLLLLGALLFLSAGCVTTTGVSVSHVWGDSGYVYPYIGAYTGAYFGGTPYIVNPIFYTPYYYKRVYVKQPPPPPSFLVKRPPPPPPVNHGYVYGVSHKAAFPAYRNTPKR